MPRSPGFRDPISVPIEGMAVSTGECTWLGRNAAQMVRSQATLAGLGTDDGDDVVTLTPGAVATSAALKAFVTASDEVQGDVVGELCSPWGDWASQPAYGAPARMLRFRGGGAYSIERAAAATSVVVQVQGRVVDQRLYDVPGGRDVPMPGSMAMVCSTTRWPGWLWANLLGLGPALLHALPGPAGVAPLRIAWAALSAGSVDPGNIGRRLVRRGRDVVVHPSAVVEGSWLQDGAQIDAGAIVRHSIVGLGAVVEPQGLLMGSVLGQGARVQRRGFATYSVIGAGAVVGGSMQLGLLGPRSMLKIGGILMDQALDSSVRALVDGQLVDVPLGMLGAALGAEAMVGAGVCVAAGRLVPPGARVVAGPDQVLVRIPQGITGSCRVVDGSLVPL